MGKLQKGRKIRSKPLQNAVQKLFLTTAYVFGAEFQIRYKNFQTHVHSLRLVALSLAPVSSCEQD